MKTTQNTVYALITLALALLTVCAPAQATVEYRYDGAGRLQKMIMDDGSDVLYQFDGAGNLLGKTNRAPHGILQLSNTELTFGVVAVGETSTQTIVLTNTGKVDLNIGTLAPPEAPFSFSNDQCSGKTLGSNQNCNIGVSLSPTQSGQVQKTFAITTDDPDALNTSITLQGGAIDTNLSVQPAALDFGTLTAGDSLAKTITLTNSGQTDIVLGSFDSSALSGSPLAVSSDTCSGKTLTPSSSCTIELTFTATNAGDFTLELNLPFDLANVTNKLAVTAKVEPATQPGEDPDTVTLPKPVLVSPENGATGLDTTVTVSWNSIDNTGLGTLDYAVNVCTDAAFTNCTPQQVSAAQGPQLKSELSILMAGTSGLLIIGLINGVSGLGRRQRLLMIAAVIALSLIQGCGTGGTDEDTEDSNADTLKHTLDGLTPNTTYYWKVIVEDSNGNKTESEVWSFTTA